MSPRRTARPGSPEELRGNLADAASRRLPNLFKDRGADEETYPSLARVVARVEPQLWDTDPTRALLVVMRRAIGQLPDEKANEQYSGWSTWREIARLLYFGSEVDPGLQTYSEYRRRMKELTGYHWNASEKDLVRFTDEVRGRLAEVLLQMEREAIERRERADLIQAEAGQPQGDLIDRPECIDRLQALVDAERMIICIWGEPGTGKSTLAEQFSRRFARGTPAPVIRCAPMLTAMTPEAEIFRQDLAIALSAEGVDPARLRPESWFSRLCEQLAGQPRSSAVILDNVETDELIAQVVHAQPKIPVIMTMRKRPQDLGIACEELGDFTESQAREFIKRHLPNEAEVDAKALAHVLGYRPLALEHAVRFVRGSDYGLRALVHDLATNLTEAISALTPGNERERSLKRLYGLILTSLERRDDALPVLDSFLAVVGGTGIGSREMLSLFMQSEVGGSHKRLYFLTGLRELGRLGLVREQSRSDVSRPVAELAMHALTYSMLRDLRGPKPLAIEAKYWEWVLHGGFRALPDDEANSFDHASLALRQWALETVGEGMPPGWVSLITADARTWIALMEAGEGDRTRTYVVRYAVRPNDVYKLDYRTGTWSTLDHDEAVMLYLLIVICWERVKPQLGTLRNSLSGDEDEPDPDGESRSEQTRLDEEVTSDDGHRHVLTDALTLQSCLDRGWSVWALCGKRFIPAATEAPPAVCPDCEALQHSTERLRDIEIALSNRYFSRQLDYKDPVTGTRLFLIRAKLRRELERSEEAADDLDRAYRFLLIATNTPDSEVLVLGQGLIREVTLLPKPHHYRAFKVYDYQLALRVYDHLLWRLKDSRGAKKRMRTTLVLERARLLEQPGQAAESRAGHKTGGDGTEAGRLDAGGVKSFGELWQQEQAE